MGLTFYAIIFPKHIHCVQEIIAINIYKIYFSMFLIKSELDNVNTTLRLHHYDNRQKHE